jgi:hypothetical protein
MKHLDVTGFYIQYGPSNSNMKDKDMKSVTEFPTFKLVQGLTAKNALLAEGKTPEEVQQNLGEKFKLEGDKLKYFVNAVEVAGQNLEKLSRVLVVSLAEGETIPPKATKVDEHHYVPEFQTDAKKIADQKAMPKGGAGAGKGKGKGDRKPKESPWGISPEEKAAKKAAAIAAAKAKSAGGAS